MKSAVQEYLRKVRPNPILHDADSRGKNKSQYESLSMNPLGDNKENPFEKLSGRPERYLDRTPLGDMQAGSNSPVVQYNINKHARLPSTFSYNTDLTLEHSSNYTESNSIGFQRSGRNTDGQNKEYSDMELDNIALKIFETPEIPNEKSDLEALGYGITSISRVSSHNFPFTPLSVSCISKSLDIPTTQSEITCSAKKIEISRDREINRYPSGLIEIDSSNLKPSDSHDKSNNTNKLNSVANTSQPINLLLPAQSAVIINPSFFLEKLTDLIPPNMSEEESLSHLSMLTSIDLDFDLFSSRKGKISESTFLAQEENEVDTSVHSDTSQFKCVEQYTYERPKRKKIKPFAHWLGDRMVYDKHGSFVGIEKKIRPYKPNSKKSNHKAKEIRGKSIERCEKLENSEGKWEMNFFPRNQWKIESYRGWKQAVIMENPWLKVITISLNSSQDYTSITEHDTVVIVLKCQAQTIIIHSSGGSLCLKQWDNLLIPKNSKFTVENNGKVAMRMLLYINKI